jgi:putative nucleotidyltransferase with HDIG domain
MKRPALRHSLPALTLLRVFLVASAAILATAAIVLSGVLTSSLRHQVIADREVSLTEFVAAIVRPNLVHGNSIVVGPKVTWAMESTIAQDPEIVTVKVWRRDGVLAWTNRAQQRIGKRFAIDAELGDALAGKTVGEIGEAEPGEATVERSLGFTRLLQVYAPIRTPLTNRVVGAYEIYADPQSADSFIAQRKHMIWGILAIVFGAMYLALAVLVRGASQTLQRRTSELRTRTRALAESYEALELGSLEAVEMLNAIVEAKDPYTAGHSQRVQRIAVLIADELELPADERDALRFGALFHDIGKVRVPDSILTKPDVLTASEREVVNRHSADGAEIVGHLSSLRASVPVILHHHERWDGRGYPAGLAGDHIPICAAIAGLADAWDAMTTDRPYRDALSIQEALDAVRVGRGSQFHPAVVDAFLRALAAQPHTIAWVVPVEAQARAAIA